MHVHSPASIRLMMALTPKRLFLPFSLSSFLSLFSAFFLALTIGSINIFWKCVWAPKSCFQPWRTLCHSRHSGWACYGQWSAVHSRRIQDLFNIVDVSAYNHKPIPPTIERTRREHVKTAKRILRTAIANGEDAWLAILAHRNTPPREWPQAQRNDDWAAARRRYSQWTLTCSCRTPLAETKTSMTCSKGLTSRRFTMTGKQRTWIPLHQETRYSFTQRGWVHACGVKESCLERETSLARTTLSWRVGRKSGKIDEI